MNDDRIRDNPGETRIALKGRDAVNAVERLICGNGLVSSIPQAAGFASAGLPAATRLPSGPGDEGAAKRSAGTGAWVHHRVGFTGPGPRHGFAVELVAGTAQEAVDHCLIAHRIARSLSAPCLATLHDDVAERLDFVALPKADWVSVARATEPVQGRSPEDVADEAFRFWSDTIGRDLGPLVADSIDEADCILVGLGGSRTAAAVIAADLRERGVACGSIGVTQVEPFPVEALGRLLDGKKAIAVVGPESEFATAELSAWVRSSVTSSSATQVGTVQLTGNVTNDSDRVCAALGLKPAVARPEPLEPPRPWVRIGVAPASPWAEAFLRGFASHLVEQAPLVVETSTLMDRSLTTLAIRSEEAPDAIAGQPLDALLVPNLSTLGRLAALDQLKPGAAVVLTCDPAHDAVAEAPLSSAEAAALGLRDVRIFQLRRDADADPQPRNEDPLDALLFRALMTAVPELDPWNVAQTSTETDLLEIVKGERLDSVLQALADDSIPPPPPPQRTEPPQEPSANWVAAARHFHVTGAGAHSTAEPPPGVGLLPHALEVLAGAHVEADAAAFRSETLLQGYVTCHQATHAGTAQSFADRVQQLVARLAQILGEPEYSGPSAPARSAAAFGRASSAFFDANALAQLQRRSPSAELPEHRKVRLYKSLRSMQAWLHRRSEEPDFVVVHHPDEADVVTPEGVKQRTLCHADPLRAAIGVFDAESQTDVVAAVRVAELELRHEYDAAIHDRALAAFDWQSFSADELAALPRVVVLISEARLRGADLAALSELLRSGRPVHVLVTETLADPPALGLESSGGFHPGLGYLAVAHREAFVLQTSAGAPEHLTDGLRQMTKSLRPAVAVVAMADHASGSPPALQLAVALAGRATPVFVFDPEAGEYWAERFDLRGNPQPEATWLTGSVRCLDAAGKEGSSLESITFAHAAAVLSAYRTHFRVLPPDAEHDDQVEVGRWLELDALKALRSVPFIWVHSGNGKLARAVLTRELAFACRDRARTWSIFQELAGEAGSAKPEEIHDGASMDSARATSESVAPIEVERVSGQAELQAATEAAVRGAMQRLVQALVDPTALEPTAAAPRAVPLESPTSEPSEVEAAPEPSTVPDSAAAVEPPPTEGPYIDTPLCTTCNECINMNNRLFVYDENQQARIGEVTAGSFKQLVTAAEKCPARCIHPGAPRPDDASATEAMVRRAAPFA